MTWLWSVRNSEIFLLFLLIPSFANSLCPRECNCYKTSNTAVCNFRTGKLTNNSLAGLPIGLTGLDLSSSKIDELDAECFNSLTSLRYLNISNNFLRTLPYGIIIKLESLKILDLSYNLLKNVNLRDSTVNRIDISNNLLKKFDVCHMPSASHINLRHNHIQNIECSNSSKLVELDLSENNLTNLNWLEFDGLSRLRLLNLSSNSIRHLTRGSKNLIDLQELDLSRNSFTVVDGGDLSAFSNLTRLHLNYLARLESVSLAGLIELRYLSLTNCPLLAHINPTSFDGLNSLETLDLRRNALTGMTRKLVENLSSLTSLQLAGNKWICDCKMTWINDINFSIDDVKCFRPRRYGSFNLTNAISNLTCSEPAILEHTIATEKAVGKSVVLECLVTGTPHPNVTWISNRGRHLTYEGDNEPSQMKKNWNENSYYASYLDDNENRMRVLKNGSLLIEYILRTDAGIYFCKAGNASVAIKFRLDFSILGRVELYTCLIGLLTAVGMGVLAVFISIIKYVAWLCSKEQRQKRKSVKQILTSLGTFKSAKFDQLSAYKTAKMDALNKYKTRKVSKMKTYKKVTFDTMYAQTARMRVYYHEQVNKIREQCLQQSLKLRESYKNMDYAGRLREQYTCQLSKVRDYSSEQLSKLHAQYKIQQQHLIKLMELLNMTSCKSAIEAECLRTESLLFDFDLDFEQHAVHVPPMKMDELDEADAESLMMNSDPSPHPKRKRLHKKRHLTDEHSDDDEDDVQCDLNGTREEESLHPNSESRMRKKRRQRQHRTSVVVEIGNHDAKQDENDDKNEEDRNQPCCS